MVEDVRKMHACLNRIVPVVPGQMPKWLQDDVVSPAVDPDESEANRPLTASPEQ
jgi:hypothetical protein